MALPEKKLSLCDRSKSEVLYIQQSFWLYPTTEETAKNSFITNSKYIPTTY